MFIAHLPSGYIAACYSSEKCQPSDRRPLFWGLLIGGMLPDVDMLYFYLVDRGATHHHLYWTHLPAFWLSVLLAGLVFARILRSRTLSVFVVSLVAGTVLHLLLDTPFGGVAWLYPFSSHLYHWVTIPATRSWWVWSFVLHWTFLFEIGICLWAAVLFFRRRVRRPL
jgi:inner membrane protein